MGPFGGRGTTGGGVIVDPPPKSHQSRKNVSALRALSLPAASPAHGRAPGRGQSNVSGCLGFNTKTFGSRLEAQKKRLAVGQSWLVRSFGDDQFSAYRQKKKKKKKKRLAQIEKKKNLFNKKNKKIFFFFFFFFFFYFFLFYFIFIILLINFIICHAEW